MGQYKASELVTELEKLRPEVLVFIAIDSENGLTRCHELDWVQIRHSSVHGTEVILHPNEYASGRTPT